MPNGTSRLFTAELLLGMRKVSQHGDALIMSSPLKRSKSRPAESSRPAPHTRGKTELRATPFFGKPKGVSEAGVSKKAGARHPLDAKA